MLINVRRATWHSVGRAGEVDHLGLASHTTNLITLNWPSLREEKKCTFVLL